MNFHPDPGCTVVQISHESGREYWATCLSVRSHCSLIRSTLPVSLTRSSVLICLLARSLHSLLNLWESVIFDVPKSVLNHSGMRGSPQMSFVLRHSDDADPAAEASIIHAAVQVP